MNFFKDLNKRVYQLIGEGAALQMRKKQKSANACPAKSECIFVIHYRI